MAMVYVVNMLLKGEKKKRKKHHANKQEIMISQVRSGSYSRNRVSREQEQTKKYPGANKKTKKQLKKARVHKVKIGNQHLS